MVDAGVEKNVHASKISFFQETLSSRLCIIIAYDHGHSFVFFVILFLSCAFLPLQFKCRMSRTPLFEAEDGAGAGDPACGGPPGRAIGCLWEVDMAIMESEGCCKGLSIIAVSKSWFLGPLHRSVWPRFLAGAYMVLLSGASLVEVWGRFGVRGRAWRPALAIASCRVSVLWLPQASLGSRAVLGGSGFTAWPGNPRCPPNSRIAMRTTRSFCLFV